MGLNHAFRIRPSKSRVDDPTKIAYKTAYGNIRGFKDESFHRIPRRFIIDSYIDNDIRETWIMDLYDIKNIKIRHMSQGSSSNVVTYLNFRTLNQNLTFIKQVVKKLSNKTTKATFNLGNGNQYNICIATKNWYRKGGNNKTWENWWDKLSSSIDSAVN